MKQMWSAERRDLPLPERPSATKQVCGLNKGAHRLLMPSQNGARQPLEILYAGPADGGADIE